MSRCLHRANITWPRRYLWCSGISTKATSAFFYLHCPHHGSVVSSAARRLAQSALVSLAPAGFWILSVTVTSGAAVETAACLVARFYNSQHTSQYQLYQLCTLYMDLIMVLLSQGQTRTAIASVRAHSVGWDHHMSRHSEYKRCNKPNIKFDASSQLEYGGNYIVHDCALLRMHARCHARCRVTVRANDAASRSFSAIPIINSNMLMIAWASSSIVRC